MKNSPSFSLLFLPCLLLFTAISASAGDTPSSCKSAVEKSYRQRAVQVEMAVIAGDLDDVELGRARSGLQERLRLDRVECQKVKGRIPLRKKQSPKRAVTAG